MPLYSFEGRPPRVDPTAFVAPTATLVGDVTVEAGASVWYGAVLRADFAAIAVRAGANVQDGAVVHTTPSGAAEIGRGATVAHGCVIHAATLEDECLVGNGPSCSTAPGSVPTAWSLPARWCRRGRRCRRACWWPGC